MKIDKLVEKIKGLEDDLDQIVDEQRQQFQYEIKNKRVQFEQAVRQRHRDLKLTQWHSRQFSLELLNVTTPH